MPELWMPGATRLDIGDHSPTDGGPAKAIAHITWDRNATAANPADLVPYETLVQYFGRTPDGTKAAPHIIWDPFTGRFTQLLPANSRSKSVVDLAGGTRTNRAGKVVLQIEAVFFPYCRVDGRVYARLVDTPCKGWAALNAWVRSWGVPDTWPMSRPTSFAANRSESVWESRAGWYGHSQVPENDHQDPGSWPEFATSQEDDMPSIDEIVAAVWNHEEPDPAKPGETLRMGAVMRYADTVAVNTQEAVAAVGTQVEALATTPTPVQINGAELIAALKADGDIFKAFSKAIADEVAARMAD